MGILEDLKNIDRLITEVEPVVIEFRGYCAKKNRKAPRPGGKGLYIESHTRDILNRMALQVQPEARDLMLEHPDMIWEFTHIRGNIDRDGIMASVLDILQQMRTIPTDSIARCNGTWTIKPSVKADYESVTVTLLPRATLDKHQ